MRNRLEIARSTARSALRRRDQILHLPFADSPSQSIPHFNPHEPRLAPSAIIIDQNHFRPKDFQQTRNGSMELHPTAGHTKIIFQHKQRFHITPGQRQIISK